jgi:CheY-like chemotaxis protein
MRLRVLAVDDDPNIRLVLEQFLKPHFEVLTANDGQEALRLLDACEPDVIVADVMMPEMDGITLAKEVRSLPRFEQTPFVFLSALSTRHDMIQAYNSGANVYLTKPVDPERLLKNIQQLIREKEIQPSAKAHAVDQVHDAANRRSRAATSPSAGTGQPRFVDMRSTGTPRLLVVDSDEKTLRTVRDTLLEHFEVVAARSGKEAIERFPVVEPDLVATELKLSSMSGFQLIRLIRATPGYEKTPIVVLSDERSDRSRRRAEKEGANGFLAKPVQPDRLIQAMKLITELPSFTVRTPKRRTLIGIGSDWRP